MRTRRACKLLATIALAVAACTVTTSDPAPAGPPQHEGGPPPAPAPAPAPAPQAGPGIGQACASGVCAAGLQCVEYYGIAGPRGPKFTSCEIRCQGGAACPGGMSCTTIADGPGAVCRPTEHAAPAPTPAPPPAPAARGETCGSGVACAAGLTCIEYYGIAGPRGPKFASCEQRCAAGKASSCPSGLTCTTIADGPGSVCRAAAASTPPTPPAPSANHGMGEACGESGLCAKGLTCLEYYGFAGAQGPKFSSCEMRCDMPPRQGKKMPPKGKFAFAGCPKGSTCTTISDGPGTVCRPNDGVKGPGPGQSDRPVR